VTRFDSAAELPLNDLELLTALRVSWICCKLSYHDVHEKSRKQINQPQWLFK
jgi:hypothetical protein